MLIAAGNCVAGNTQTAGPTVFPDKKYASSPSSWSGTDEMTADVKREMASVEEVKKLPVGGLSMLRAGDKIFMITDNGHFVIAGNFKMVDMWQGKVIGTMEDLKGIDKIDLRKIGLSPDEMGAFTLGSGKKEVTIFVDPQCGYCNGLLKQIKEIKDGYTFKIVLVPVLGSESADISKKLLCEKDKNKALDILISKDFSKLPALAAKGGKDVCDLKPLQKSVVATKLLDIKGVPFSFLPSKNTFRGGAESFKTVLEKDLEDEVHGR